MKLKKHDATLGYFVVLGLNLQGLLYGGTIGFFLFTFGLWLIIFSLEE